ncbi:MAG: hypothetical protein U0996_16625 [Planctomycetaceae bacterium]
MRRSSHMMNTFFARIVAAAFALLCTVWLVACPFCLAPPQTFSEQMLLSDVVVIAELLKFEVLNNGTVPRSTLRIRHLLRGDERLAARFGIGSGRIIVLPAEAAGKPGDLFLMFGDLPDLSTDSPALAASNGSEKAPASEEAAKPETAGEKIRSASLSRTVSGSPGKKASLMQKVSWEIPGAVVWADFEALSPSGAEYVQQLPSRDLPAPQRLAFFNDYLESSDPNIAVDAWAEFGGAAYADVKVVRHLFRPEKLRAWISDPLMSPERLGLYGLMLGLCGEPSDAEFLLQNQRNSNTGEFRFGGEGLMAGYLLLTGEEGLQHCREQALSASATDSLRHAFIQSLQFFMSYEPDVLSRESICGSMREMLAVPSMRDIAITNLARWEDWSILPQLMTMYETEYANDAAGQRIILQYADACQKAAVRKSETEEAACVASEFIARMKHKYGSSAKATTYEFRAPQ